ncbi:hypothetical protein NQZ68_036174 [Dissostichus eleginoides]|nr:hypothetical protein NQZ68_036174 [Dissostichus eleginoides]
MQQINLVQSPYVTFLLPDWPCKAVKLYPRLDHLNWAPAPPDPTAFKVSWERGPQFPREGPEEERGGHRRRGTESINGVAVPEKRRADVIAMGAGGMVLQEPTMQAVGGGYSVGEGEWQRYRIPCAHGGSDVWSRTKKRGRVGQREQGMEMWGGFEEREDRRMVETPGRGHTLGTGVTLAVAMLGAEIYLPASTGRMEIK